MCLATLGRSGERAVNVSPGLIHTADGEQKPGSVHKVLRVPFGLRHLLQVAEGLCNGAATACQNGFSQRQWQILDQTG